MAAGSSAGRSPLGDNRRIAPVWSPDGTKIALVGFVEGQTETFTVDANGGDLWRFTTHAGTDIHPYWTADSWDCAWWRRRTSPT